MTMDAVNRRSFLKSIGGAGMMSALPVAMFGLPAMDSSHIVHEVAEPGQDASAKPKDSIRFSVCGMSHDHL